MSRTEIVILGGFILELAQDKKLRVEVSLTYIFPWYLDMIKCI